MCGALFTVLHTYNPDIICVEHYLLCSRDTMDKNIPLIFYVFDIV